MEVQWKWEWLLNGSTSSVEVLWQFIGSGVVVAWQYSGRVAVEW